MPQKLKTKTEKKQPKNCWEFWKCPPKTRKDCLAFTTNAGQFCWFFKGLFSPKMKRDFQHCWECPWYQSKLQST